MNDPGMHTYIQVHLLRHMHDQKAGLRTHLVPLLCALLELVLHLRVRRKWLGEGFVENFSVQLKQAVVLVTKGVQDFVEGLDGLIQSVDREHDGCTKQIPVPRQRKEGTDIEETALITTHEVVETSEVETQPEHGSGRVESEYIYIRRTRRRQ